MFSSQTFESPLIPTPRARWFRQASPAEWRIVSLRRRPAHPSGVDRLRSPHSQRESAETGDRVGNCITLCSSLPSRCLGGDVGRHVSLEDPLSRVQEIFDHDNLVGVISKIDIVGFLAART